MKHLDWTFFCGCAPFHYYGFFAREKDELSDKNVVATTFFRWNERSADPQQTWSVYSHVVDWRAQAMASVKDQGTERLVVCVGRQGQYYELYPGGPTQFDGAIAEEELFPRALTVLQGIFFVAGLGRMVRRRTGRGQWIEFGPGAANNTEEEVVGFEAIGGLSADRIYVAGWHGEIWQWNGQLWQQVDCPTDANLNALACAPDGTVYIVGDDGILIRGLGDQWLVLESARLENLLDVAVFGEEVFAVTDYRILRLTDDGFVDEDRFAEGDAPGSCLKLLSAADGVVSMGPKDLFTFSAGTWRRVV